MPAQCGRRPSAVQGDARRRSRTIGRVAARLTLDDLARLPAPGMDAPAKLSFAPDGRSVLFLAPADQSNRLSLWRWEPNSGRRTELLAPIAAADEASLRAEDVLRRERTRERALGVTDYHVAERADRLAVLAPLDGRAHVSIDGGPATVVEGLSGLQDVRLATDGLQLAWVRDGDLYAAPLGTTGTLGAVRRVSADAEDGVTNGLAEYQAAEELGRDRGFWWSRDGRAIAYAHVDERGVPPFVIQHLATDPPRVERHRYPFAGGPNPAVSLRIARLGDGAPWSRAVALPMDPGDYLARVLPLPGDGWLVAVLPRVQRILRWLRVGTDASCTELWVESASPWLNLDDHTTRARRRPLPPLDRGHRLPAPRAARRRRWAGAHPHRGSVGRHRRRGGGGGAQRGALHRDARRRPRAAPVPRAARRAPAGHGAGTPDRGAGLARGGGHARRCELDRSLVEPRLAATRGPCAARGRAAGPPRSGRSRSATSACGRRS